MSLLSLGRCFCKIFYEFQIELARILQFVSMAQYVTLFRNTMHHIYLEICIPQSCITKPTNFYFWNVFPLVGDIPSLA